MNLSRNLGGSFGIAILSTILSQRSQFHQSTLGYYTTNYSPNFVAALNCVLAQRLVRKLCVVCKRHYTPSDEEILISGLKPEIRQEHEFYMSVGCDACNHTGYRGRTAIHELLDMTDKIREMIVARRPGSEIRREAEKEGLSSLRVSALKKVYNGQTTLHEINRVTFVEELK